MNARLLKSFKSIFEDEKNLESYNNYYIALRDWIKNNKYLFSNELKNHIRLNTLIQLDINDYDLEKIGHINISLVNEKDRMTEINYKTTDDLLKEIDSVLWNMVAIEADFECDCIDGDLRYIIDLEENNEILIKCNFCAQLYDIYGNKINRTIRKYKPATSLDIQRFVVVKKK